MAGVSATTVRGWLRRGRREPDGPFGKFLRDTQPAGAVQEPMTLAEAEQHLAKAIRKGSVTALALWFRRHDGPGASDDADDPLLDFVPRSHGGRG